MFDYNNPYGMYGIGANYGAQQRFPNQMMNQPTMMQNVPQQAQNTPQSNFNWLHFKSVDELDKITLSAGETIWFMIENEPIFGYKKGVEIGKPVMELFRFEKIGATEKEEKYVTRKEFLAFVKQFEPEKGAAE